VAPSNDSTRGAIHRGVLSKMKPSAFFINMGRGNVVDEEALIDHLKEGKIAGAALDTFAKEPLPEDSPLWDMENVMVTPHIGGKSDIYGEQAAAVFRKNLKLFLEGKHREMINFISRE
jgi:phosphoglycerate dehydrogenase-like enzyme